MRDIKRDLSIIEDILEYCDEIEDAIERFGNYYESLLGDKHYKNSVSMCILQIGELSSRLTEDFKQKYNAVPWREIKDMRNVTAHEYRKMEIDILWDTITADIPNLRKYCEKILELEDCHE